MPLNNQSQDVYGPVLNSITLRKDTLSVGDTVFYDLDISDETGVAVSSKILIENEFEQYWWAHDSDNDGSYTLEITGDMPSGDYKISYISLQDTNSITNSSTYWTWNVTGNTNPSIHELVDLSNTNFTVYNSLKTVNLNLKSWTGKYIDNTIIKVENKSGLEVKSLITNSSGNTNFSIGEDVTISFQKKFTNNNIITAQDALDALRLSVGLNKTDGTVHTYDYIAADFNKDGKVSANDALEILKYSVNISTVEASWVFVPNKFDITDISKENVRYNDNLSLSFNDFQENQNITAILLGDVTGTF